MSLPANQQNKATAVSSPVSESVEQSPLAQFHVLPVATFVLCRNSQCRPLPTLHFQLPFRPCSSNHHPNSQHTRFEAPLYQLILTGNRQKSSSPSLWRIRLSQETVSPDNRITIHSYALRKSKPTSFLKIAGHTQLGGQHR
jgi:hypothetical protein